MSIDKNDFKEFESGFLEDPTELIFLTVESVSGAAQVSDNSLRPCLEFVASYNPKTGDYSKGKGRLEWLIENTPERKGWGYNFKKFNIYHIRCRKNKPVDIGSNMRATLNNCYMVIDVIDDNMTDSRLEKLKAIYLKPVYIEDDNIGKFTLNRELSAFLGTVDWCGNECSALLHTDRYDGKTAKKSLGRLQSIWGYINVFDLKVREYIVEKITDIANEWADSSSINKEQLLSYLSANELSVESNGDLTIYYVADKDIFTDHAIEVVIDKNDKIKRADLAG